MKQVKKWVDIIGFEKYYKVSDFGDVYSKRQNRLLSTSIKGTYSEITLFGEGESKKVRIHVLVGTHFISNLKNLPEVNHKDFDKTNNHISNLEWCTHKENVNHYVKSDRYICSSKTKIDHNIIMDIYTSKLKASDLSRKYKLSEPFVRDIRNGFKCNSVTGVKKGEKKKLIKLSEDKVVMIFNNKEPYKKIAIDFGISVSTVSSIKNGYKYARITMGVKNKNQ